MEFSPYDKRNYPFVSPEEGYSEWAAHYENAILDEMDLALLDRLDDWSPVPLAFDLACGTGRVGAWLTKKGAARAIDGVDITEAMMTQARDKGCYREIFRADIRDTGRPSGIYDLVTQSLACEHLPDLRPLYAEAARLCRPTGRLIIVGYHPCFMIRGVPTHFDRKPGEPIAIETNLHLTSDHVNAATRTGWRLARMEERLVDDSFVEKKASWEKHRGWPITFLLDWRRP